MGLRQSYARVGKFALIQHQRYAHAKQFKRANRMLKKLRTYLGRVIRDIGRKIEGNGGLEAAFAKLLLLARRVREQQQRQRGPKVYSLHAPEVECIGKGKVHRPYEFGVKVSVATTLKHCKGGQFVTHVKALPGNPYDGHTLATVIPDMEALVGNTIARILADKGYRGHNAPPDYKFRVFLSGQKRGVTPTIKREFRRRSAVEPVIGHLKAEHRMGRNYLWFRRGDANNAVLAAAGYNFRRLIRWLRLLLCQILSALYAEPADQSNLKLAFFTDIKLKPDAVGVLPASIDVRLLVSPSGFPQHRQHNVGGADAGRLIACRHDIVNSRKGLKLPLAHRRVGQDFAERVCKIARRAVILDELGDHVFANHQVRQDHRLDGDDAQDEPGLDRACPISGDHRHARQRQFQRDRAGFGQRCRSNPESRTPFLLADHDLWRHFPGLDAFADEFEQMRHGGQDQLKHRSLRLQPLQRFAENGHMVPDLAAAASR